MKITLPQKPRQQAVALVMVMLVILALGVLAASFAFSMKVELRLAGNLAKEPDMEWLGRSGLELARFVLAEKARIPEERGFDALSQMWAGGPLGTNEVLMEISLSDVRLGEGRINVRIQDLERKFNVNVVDEPFLNRTMQVIGVDPFVSEVIVDSLLDWLDSNQEPRLNGADGEDYITTPNPPFPPYISKNGPIDHIAELLLIRGIEPSLYYGLGKETSSPLTTSDPSPETVGLHDIFTSIGGPRVNINTASTVVLSLIPGLNEILAREIVRFRRGEDQLDGTIDDMPFRSLNDLSAVPGMDPELMDHLRRFCITYSKTFEVVVESQFGDYVKTYQAILVRPNPRNVFVVSFHPL